MGTDPKVEGLEVRFGNNEVLLIGICTQNVRYLSSTYVYA